MEGTITRSGILRYFFNTSWLLVEQLLRLGSGIFVGAYVARYLGPGQFGFLSYVLAIVSVLSVFAKLGIDNIAVRNLVSHRAEESAYLGSMFWMKCLAGIFCLSVVLLVLPFCSEQCHVTSSVAILSVGLIFQAFEVMDFYFQSIVQARYVVVCKVVQIIISSGIKITLILIGAKLDWFVYVTLVDQVTLGIAYWIMARHVGKTRLFGSGSVRMALSMLRQSWPLAISGLGIVAYMRLDQIMLQSMLGDAAVGQYSAALRLSEATYVIPTIICSSLYPALIKSKSENPAVYKIRTALLFEVLVLIAYGLAIPSIFFSGFVLHLLFGSSYSSSGRILSVHIWTSVFVFLGVAGGRWMVAAGIYRLTMYRVFTGVACNALLNLMLIPRLGILGAAIASLISQALTSVAMNAIHQSTRECFYLQLRAIFMPGYELVRTFRNAGRGGSSSLMNR
ncbi:flippase [Burkholderia sp. Bp8998]|uniref:flippase n=1 Tax=Burkholderia sp. Bp8998 TaxID=2184557 RepID=UPI000F5A7DDE|nr:flippase [Burkholderia sp. Bp8998]RQS08869.1 flippase [Burkholderia sp. Bp8998]